MPNRVQSEPVLFVTMTVLYLLGVVVGQARAQAAQTPPPQAPRRITLDEALALGEQRSEQVTIARAGIDRADSTITRARSDLFPQLDGSASYDRTLDSEFRGLFDTTGPSCTPFTPVPGAPIEDRVTEIERALVECPPTATFGGGDAGELPFGRDNTWRLGLLLNQYIYTGGRIRAQTDQARAGKDRATFGLTGTRAEVALDVATAYFDAAVSDRLVVIAEAALDQAEATLKQVELTYKVGSQSEFEVVRARVARDNQRPVVIRRRSDRDLAYLRLKQLLDIPLNEPIEVVVEMDTVTGAPAQRFASALADAEARIRHIERTVVDEAQTDVVAAEAAVRVARAAKLPNVRVNSSYGPVSYDNLPTSYRTNWTVGVIVAMPILTGGRLRADENIAKANLAESQAALQQTRELATLDTYTAYEEYRAARATWDASSGTVEEAQRAYEIAELRYKEGLSTQLELSDARLALELARANRAVSARDLQVARVRLVLLPDLPLRLGAVAAQAQTGASFQQASAPTAQGVTAAGAVATTGTAAGTVGVR
jgi:outer membrane protein TolC